MVNRIKALRQMFKISQIDLAKELNISQKRVSNIENGILDPSLKEIFILMKLFKCKFEDLFINEEESVDMAKGILIKYIHREDHIDPNYTHLVYGDSDKRAARLKNIVDKDSTIFFQTTIDGKAYITGCFVVEKILKAGEDDEEIKTLDCDAKYDSLIVIGSRKESKILTSPLCLDKKLVNELKSLEITEDRFTNSNSTELSVISSATREHRVLSEMDVKILKDKCKLRG